MVLEVAGVSHEEESVYRLLVTSGRATTEDLARCAGLTDADAARILDSLALKGLASHTDGTPRLFRAAPPDVALLPRLKRSADTLELARLEATRLIQAYQDTMRRHDAGQLLEVITGAEALRQHLRQIQTCAQDEMLWFCKAQYVAMPSGSALHDTALTIVQTNATSDTRDGRLVPPGARRGDVLCAEDAESICGSCL
ncbi:helix-turn-helix domain-containing protein [Streptomyces sp. NPDC001634]|uniref:TrmB family transcriptional regulator n=1 Tax=Streptomyces sp. NPDC001634 TaxID=3154390 RepID=UPI00331E03C9